MEINHSIQVYRTFDYELSCLIQAGLINMSNEARKALIACYKKEPYVCEVPLKDTDDVEKLPPRRVFRVEIDDTEAPGIVDWFYKIKRGYRNNFIKQLVKNGLSPEWMSYYREDTQGPQTESVRETQLQTTEKSIFEKRTAAQDARASARDKKQKEDLKKDEPLFENAKNDFDDPDDFDAFSALMSLHKG